jgi:hypothetical protein
MYGLAARCKRFRQPGQMRHGVLLVLSAPCQLLVLAGPEHGRTIPLADTDGRAENCHPPPLKRKPRAYDVVWFLLIGRTGEIR